MVKRMARSVKAIVSAPESDAPKNFAADMEAGLLDAPAPAGDETEAPAGDETEAPAPVQIETEAPAPAGDETEAPAPAGDETEAPAIPTAKIKEIAAPSERTGGNANNNAGVAASWKNAEIAAARSKTHYVSVDGVEMGSARKAFMALYPSASTAARQKFRKELVAAGTLFDTKGRLWTIING